MRTRTVHVYLENCSNIFYYNKHVENTEDAQLKNISNYQKLIRKLLYLKITGPDICFAVQVLSQFMQLPKESHMESALRVAKYIKGSPGLGILLSIKQTTHS